MPVPAPYAAPACPFCGSAAARVVYQRQFQQREWGLARCPDCALHFTSPCPTLADLHRFYAGDYHRQLCQPGASERFFGSKLSRYRSWIVQFLAGGRSLDVGCATGLLPYLLQQSGFAAEGIELNPETAAWGQEHYQVPIRNQPVESGEYAEAAYDLVTMTDVLEHTVHPLTSLRAVARIVRPGGCILITFPDIGSLESHYYWALARLFRRGWLWSTCHIPLHTWEFTPATARAMFAAAGLQVAGFRRSQPGFQWPKESVLLGLLAAPTAMLSLGPIARWAGTQMEFMLRKPASAQS